jgi:hypothetical protein
VVEESRFSSLEIDLVGGGEGPWATRRGEIAQKVVGVGVLDLYRASSGLTWHLSSSIGFKRLHGLQKPIEANSCCNWLQRCLNRGQMNTWTPLWSSTVDSTLWEESKDVRIMFLTLLMVRDPDHVVRLPMRVLAKKANLSEDKEEAYRLAEAAMGVLEAPDHRSHDEQEFQGRRIEKTAEGYWLVLNGQKYLDQMRTLWSRMRRTQKQKERRHQTSVGSVVIPDANRIEEKTAEHRRRKRQMPSVSSSSNGAVSGSSSSNEAAKVNTPAPAPTVAERMTEALEQSEEVPGLVDGQSAEGEVV